MFRLSLKVSGNLLQVPASVFRGVGQGEWKKLSCKRRELSKPFPAEHQRIIGVLRQHDMACKAEAWSRRLAGISASGGHEHEPLSQRQKHSGHQVDGFRATIL